MGIGKLVTCYSITSSILTDTCLFLLTSGYYHPSLLASLFNAPLVCILLILNLRLAQTVIQSCQSLCDPMDCSPPDSTALWDFLLKKARVGGHFLLQGIVPTLRLNLCLLHWQVNSLLLSQWTTPKLKSLLPNFHTFCGSLGEKMHYSSILTQFRNLLSLPSPPGSSIEAYSLQIFISQILPTP